MHEVAKIDHLKALPVLVTLRTKTGRILSRGEDAIWTESGTHEPPVLTEEDFPAKVIWDYAQEIGDPGTDALARLALVMIAQQTQREALAGVAQQNGQSTQKIHPCETITPEV